LANEAFIKEYGPSIKFHNPHLKLNRTLDPSHIQPLIKVYNTKGELIDSFGSGSMQYPQILERIEKLNEAQSH
jgi:hypothetical protein